MSFGKINKIMKFTDKIIKNNNFDKIKQNSYYDVINQIYKEAKEVYPEVTFNLIIDIFNKKYNTKFILKEELSFDNGTNCFPEYNKLYQDVIVPEEYEHLQKQFIKLQNLPQPEQRTPEWFAYRRNRITASDTAAAIDENPYEPQESFIDKKCDPDHKFLDNSNVAWGKKYEFTATGIYQHIFNVEVIEFGALPSDRYEFLGASPDGICSCRTLDNKFSEKLGTMLEIKCVAPNGRTIETSGEIRGHICPYYYYLQVQQQLECCDLDICDFWQCKILEYNSKIEYLVDKCNNTFHTEGTSGKKVIIDNKSMILEFHPHDWEPEFEGDLREWKSKYIYPPRLDMTEKEYDDWFVRVMNELHTQYADVVKTHYFHKVVYWRLVQSHNQPIKRDKELFAKILPVLKETWKQVQYYRENLDKLVDLKKIVERRKKYIKINTDFNINTDIIKNKVLFLESKEKKVEPIEKKKIKKLQKKDESDTEEAGYIKKESVYSKPKVYKTISKSESPKNEKKINAGNINFLDD
jgi:putative phage-type endonuclease